MKKIILFSFVLILLSSFVNAVPTAPTLSEVDEYFNFDDSEYSAPTLNGLVGNYDLTNSGSTTGQTGIINEAWDFDGINDYAVTTSTIDTSTGKLSVNIWFNCDASASDDPIIQIDQNADGIGFRFLSAVGLQVFEKINNDYDGLNIGGFCSAGVWTMYTITLEDSTNELKVYINTSLVGTLTTDANMGEMGNPILYVGYDHFYYGTGKYDELSIYNDILTSDEMDYLYNSGSPGPSQQYDFTGVPEFELTALNIYNTTAINNFSATINNGTTTQTIHTTNGSIYWGTGQTINITVFNATNYFNRTYINYSTSVNLNAELTPYFYSHNDTYYTNYTLYSSTNYVRSLNYAYNVTCRNGTNTNVSIYVNGSYTDSELIDCYDTKHEYTGTYTHDTEGNYSYYFYIENVDGNAFFGQNNFYWDLYNPQIIVNFTNVGTFNILANVSLLCVDTVSPILEYNLSFNSNILFYGNLSNNTHQYNTSTISSGSNTARGVCYDFVSSNSSTYTKSVYTKEIVLIDEIDNVNFDVTNISDARVYYSDEEYYSFTDEATHAVNITSFNNTKLRFRLEYPPVDGQEVVITRYIDMALIDEEQLRVCANKDGVTHYEQQLISASETAAVLKSSYPNCLIAADYTRFAYQDAFLLKAYSISTLYYLYTFDDANQVLLASVDGSVATYMNLDTLEFKKQGYNMNILGEGLSFEKSGTSQVLIYYKNNDDTNTGISVVITDMATNTQVLSTSDIADPNEFTIYFNYATLNVTNATLYRIAVTKTTADGTDTINRYFNPQAGSGYIKNELAMVLAALLTIFGLTFVAPRLTFSWFGIIMLIFSVAVLSFSVGAWYVNFLIFVDIILIVFSFILMTNQNYPTVAG